MDDQSEKRARILAVSWILVAEQGVSGLTFRALAQRAGVSPGLVQHYFGTKDTLVRASVEAMIDGAAQRHLSEDPPSYGALRRVIAHGIPHDAPSRHGVSAWFAFVTAGFTDRSIAEVLTRAKRGQESEAARMLAALGASGDPVSTARGLIAMADGLALRVLDHDLTADEARHCIEEVLAATITRATRVT